MTWLKKKKKAAQVLCWNHFYETFLRRLMMLQFVDTSDMWWARLRELKMKEDGAAK